MAKDTIDFCLGWGPWPDEPFSDMISHHCRVRKLSCVVCKDGLVRGLIRDLQAGKKRLLFHLDLNADYDDADEPYARLGYAAKDSGAFVVNDPDHARQAANKAVLHYRFEKAGVPVPFTVVVRNWEPAAFALTPAERRKLGRPFIIKPARGYGKQGVAQVDAGSVREIARARQYDEGDDFLLQQLVEPQWFGHRMGWFRVFFLFGQVILCWWDKATEHYACVSVQEFEDHDLLPAAEIAWSIAQTSAMYFYTTELAIARSARKRRWFAIDYVNDPCDVTVQTHSHCGVPDRVVQHIAERLVEGAWRVKNGKAPSEGLGIWFPEVT